MKGPNAKKLGELAAQFRFDVPYDMAATCLDATTESFRDNMRRDLGARVFEMLGKRVTFEEKERDQCDDSLDAGDLRSRAELARALKARAGDAEPEDVRLVVREAERGRVVLTVPGEPAVDGGLAVREAVHHGADRGEVARVRRVLRQRAPRLYQSPVIVSSPLGLRRMIVSVSLTEASAGEAGARSRASAPSTSSPRASAFASWGHPAAGGSRRAAGDRSRSDRLDR